MTRPRLQLHLSTILILMSLAGVLVWLNGRGSPPGWPLKFQWVGESQIHLAINAVVCIALLLIAGAATEWLTRRMKRGAQ